MKRSIFQCLHLGKLLILMLIVVCAICAYVVRVKRTVIPLTLEASQLCTNHVVSCAVDNAHPGFVAIGCNKKVTVIALDLEKTGVVNVQIVNCMSHAVALKCVADEMWDVDLPSYIHSGESGMMSIWAKESGGDSRISSDDPDIELYDENVGCLLCALYVREMRSAGSNEGQQL